MFGKRFERPVGAPIMYQEWRHLLFLHWKWDVEEIQKTLPKGLHVDTFDGSAYISIVPFFIQNLRAKFLPRIPFLSDFLEVNLRTYVRDDKGMPGIWFYSLDINSFIATKAAQTFFFLPYRHADLSSRCGDSIAIWGRRDDVHMSFDYQVKGGEKHAETDLDFFLLERYVLFSFDGSQLYQQRIHHAPYVLSGVDLIKYESNLIDPSFSSPEIVHYSRGLNVDFFRMEKNFS